jgi:BolA protein
LFIQTVIEEKLVNAISTLGLEVLNESYMHNVPDGSETHFKVIIISDDFNGMRILQRHKLVNSILMEEFKNGVHALSIQALTQEEWHSKGEKIMPSPKCLGGSK